MNEKEKQDLQKQLLVAALTGLAFKANGKNETTIAELAVKLAKDTFEAWEDAQPKQADWLE